MFSFALRACLYGLDVQCHIKFLSSKIATNSVEGIIIHVWDVSSYRAIFLSSSHDLEVHTTRDLLFLCAIVRVRNVLTGWVTICSMFILHAQLWLGGAGRKQNLSPSGLPRFKGQIMARLTSSTYSATFAGSSTTSQAWAEGGGLHSLGANPQRFWEFSFNK